MHIAMRSHSAHACEHMYACALTHMCICTHGAGLAEAEVSVAADSIRVAVDSQKDPLLRMSMSAQTRVSGECLGCRRIPESHRLDHFHLITPRRDPNPRIPPVPQGRSRGECGSKTKRAKCIMGLAGAVLADNRACKASTQAAPWGTWGILSLSVGRGPDWCVPPRVDWCVPPRVFLAESGEKAGLGGFQKRLPPGPGVPQKLELRAAGAGGAPAWLLLPGDMERVERTCRLSDPGRRWACSWGADTPLLIQSPGLGPGPRGNCPTLWRPLQAGSRVWG